MKNANAIMELIVLKERVRTNNEKVMVSAIRNFAIHYEEVKLEEESVFARDFAKVQKGFLDEVQRVISENTVHNSIVWQRKELEFYIDEMLIYLQSQS